LTNLKKKEICFSSLQVAMLNPRQFFGDIYQKKKKALLHSGIKLLSQPASALKNITLQSSPISLPPTFFSY